MRRGVTLAASATVGRRLMEAGLNEAAVGPALWAEYLGALAATAIAVGDLMCLGAPVDERIRLRLGGDRRGATARRDREGRDRRLMIVPAEQGA